MRAAHYAGSIGTDKIEVTLAPTKQVQAKMIRVFNKYILPSFAGMCCGATLMYMEMDIYYKDQRQKYQKLREELTLKELPPAAPPPPTPLR